MEMDEPTPNVIIPRKAVNELIKLLGGVEGNLAVVISDAKVEVTMGNLTLLSKLIDGTFPDYERVIPSGSTIHLKVNPKELHTAIDRVSVVATEKTRAVRLQVSKKQIKLSVNSPDAGTAEEVIEAESNGEVEIGFNSKYLLDVLSNYSDNETILISMENGTAPALIKPKKDEIDLSVLMPMRI